MCRQMLSCAIVRPRCSAEGRLSTMAGDPGRPGEASSQMLQLLNSFLTVQGLHVAAPLGIADLLADGARGVDDLANAAGAHPASLYRLMRMLAGAGVFREEADGRFALTPLGGSLRSEGPESVRDWALFVGAPEMWETWGSLRDSVMSGEAVFPRTHGMALWEYMAMHPEVGTPMANRHGQASAPSREKSLFSWRGHRNEQDVGPRRGNVGGNVHLLGVREVSVTAARDG